MDLFPPFRLPIVVVLSLVDVDLVESRGLFFSYCHSRPSVSSSTLYCTLSSYYTLASVTMMEAGAFLLLLSFLLGFFTFMLSIVRSRRLLSLFRSQTLLKLLLSGLLRCGFGRAPRHSRHQPLPRVRTQSCSCPLSLRTAKTLTRARA